MRNPFYIKKVAVLGAGVMGAQIAAHCVNAGIQTLLYDLTAKEGQPNSIVDKALAHLTKLKPSPLASSDIASLIHPCNYDQNLDDLASCDLVIEAIAERMDWKKALYERIAPFIQEHTVLVSNTSGLSINSLCDVLPKELRERFCGVHFFNPPRYMHLAELIPAKTTSESLLDNLETWLTSHLGKGVVRAKDTPNFIANRIGVFSLLATLHHTMAMDMQLDEVDALTGTLLGRPKSATYRTMDVVGLDTMNHVIKTMKEQLSQDPWHASFTIPKWLEQMISEGHLGQKSGQGIYKKNGKVIEVFDISTKSYRPAQSEISDALKAIMSVKEPEARMKQLFASNNKQAKFLAACFRDVFHYCAYHCADIADTVRDVDFAMRWGFGWSQGPFETWQSSGFQFIVDALQEEISKGASLTSAPLPNWVHQIKEFYSQEGAYSPTSNQFKPRSSLAVYQRQFFPDSVLHEPIHKTSVLYENEGICLRNLKDDVAVLSFKSKANTIGQSVLDGMQEGIKRAEEQCQGLIIYQNDASNFSSGADLRGVAQLIMDEKFDALSAMIKQFQEIALKLRYVSIPTIAAVRGRALGGGCELMMHCDAVVAAFESYPGLVELGVGVIPAGGGTKEMAMRAAQMASQGDLMLFLHPLYQQIATAQVASSALDARNMSYFRSTDTWVMHANEVLYAAVGRVKAMQASNYTPPLAKPFKIAGIEGYARFQAALVNWLSGGFISEYDYVLADTLAKVLCGGDLNQGTLVDEQWMLDLEREAFVRLASNTQTKARINNLLETGKPLRN